MSGNFLTFVPSTVTAFSFQPTLNGTQYLATVQWNIFGLRYFVNLSDLYGNVIALRPMTGSGPQLQATFSWDGNIATAVCAEPHNVPVGQLANIVVTGTDTGFDGAQQVLAVNSTTFTYALTTDPEATPAGIVAFNVDILAGTGIGPLYYHPDTTQFEW